MSSRVRDTLAALGGRARETERALKLSNAERDRDVGAYGEAVAAGVREFASSVARELESVKAQADELEVPHLLNIRSPICLTYGPPSA